MILQNKKRRPITAIIATITFLTVLPATPALADHRIDAQVHCAVEAYPLDGDHLPTEPACFETTEEVQQYLTDVVAPTIPSGRALVADLVLGVTYSDANGGGSSLTYWGSSGCAGVTFGFATMPSGWSNNVSSATGSNGCWVTLYSATNYGGSRLTCTPWCGGVGSLNDAVKSLLFRPQGTFG